MKHLTALLFVLFAFSPSFAQQTLTDDDVMEQPVVGEEVDDDFFTIVEKMPEYPGGDAALMEWVSKEVQYPSEAVQKKIQGTVYVSYIIGRDGSVQSVKVKRGVHPLLDEEAIRVVQNIEGYKPGRQDGKPVRVQFTLPIRFKL